jgi:hypothetical protein
MSRVIAESLSHQQGGHMRSALDRISRVIRLGVYIRRDQTCGLWH